MHGFHIPNVPFQDSPYSADDFFRQLEKMKDSSVGFDGWTRVALRLLPVKAWHHRAQIENLAKDKGIFLDAHLHVALPMLPN